MKNIAKVLGILNVSFFGATIFCTIFIIIGNIFFDKILGNFIPMLFLFCVLSINISIISNIISFIKKDKQAMVYNIVITGIYYFAFIGFVTVFEIALFI